MVVRDPAVMSGAPTFRGTRVLVHTLFETADQAGYEVLITVDQNMPNQQSYAAVQSRYWLFEHAPRISMICWFC